MSRYSTEEDSPKTVLTARKTLSGHTNLTDQVEHWVLQALLTRPGITEHVTWALSFQAMPDPSSASWTPFIFLYLQIPGRDGEGIIYQMQALNAFGATEPLVGDTVEECYRAMVATREASLPDLDEAVSNPS